MTLGIGQQLQTRYRITNLLGQGGMGAVYRAWDMNLDIFVAIKENLDASEEAYEQFIREARILARLSHPNLPRVTDYFFIQGQGQYLVMDYIEGEDLESMITRLANLPENQVLQWVADVCDALGYLHSQPSPIIHRDIKPANIKIKPDGRAVLVDFGIAKVYDPRLSTTIGAKAVTPGYSPPEQYGGGHTDVRADVYALGATLYRLLTGETLPESVQRVVSSRSVPSPRELNPRVSPSVNQAIMRAIEVTTDRRYQNVNELRSALTRPLPQEQPQQPAVIPQQPLPLRGRTARFPDQGGGAPPPSQPPAYAAGPAYPTGGSRPVNMPSPAAPPRSAGRRLWIWGAVVALVLVLGAGAVLLANAGVFDRAADSATPKVATERPPDDALAQVPSPTPTAATPTLTAAPPDALPDTATPTSTPEATTPAATATTKPADTSTPTPTTPPPTATPTALPTATPTPTTTPTPTELPTPETPSDTISGMVTHLGAPVSGIPVALNTECNGAGLLGQTFTDAQGRYAFTGVTPGSYRVMFNGSNNSGAPVAPYGGSCTWKLEKQNAAPLALNWSLHKTDLQITFPTAGSAIGTTTPTFTWNPYPNAATYEIVLSQASPTYETLEFLTPSTGVTFTPSQPLNSGYTYDLIVWGYTAAGEQFVNGSVRFSVQAP
ncbi:MAG: protein kinase [Anaerolineae bacterium]|nr:protein kinase [Anaerolineae bacterium]